VRLLARILFRLALPILMLGGYAALRPGDDLGPLAAVLPAAGAGEAVQVDPQAEADGIALALRLMAERLRNGAGPGGGAGTASVPASPAPTFRRPPQADAPRVLNGGGAGHFRQPPPAR
jgi:hypothetical protein